MEILLAVKEQATVLFSTHILSDVERICTDVAFLNNGVISIQGKLADVKAKYRRDEYLIETEKEADVSIFQKSFLDMRQISINQLSFYESEYAMFDMLRFIADKHIPLLKLERAEPTFESLFMEVVE